MKKRRHMTTHVQIEHFRAPISKAIDAVVRCTRCRAPRSKGCRCWVTLRCAKCRATIRVERTKEDGDDDEVVTLCPEHAPKDTPRSA